MSLLFPNPPAPRPDGAPVGIRDFLDQGKWFHFPISGWVRVKHMTPGQRADARRLLLRHASTWAKRIGNDESWSLAGAPDDVWASWEREDSERRRDPQKWMRGTKLYRKLAKKSKIDMRVDDNR